MVRACPDLPPPPTGFALPQHCRPALVGSGRRARSLFLLLSSLQEFLLLSVAGRVQPSLSAVSTGTFCYIYNPVFGVPSGFGCQMPMGGLDRVPCEYGICTSAMTFASHGQPTGTPYLPKEAGVGRLYVRLSSY